MNLRTNLTLHFLTLFAFLLTSPVLWADKKQEKQCKSLEQSIKGYVSRLTGKNIIIDNQRLARAQLLLTLHARTGCSAEELAEQLPRLMKPLKK